MPSSRKKLDELAKRFEPRLEKAFLDAIDGIKSRARIKDLVALLEAGDILGALNHLDISESLFIELETEIAAIYRQAGSIEAGTLPRFPLSGQIGTVQFLFDGRNPVAEEWIRRQSSTLITLITDEQREVIRFRLLQGLAAGRNPRDSALDLVGRINPATGKREGGIIGLTIQQEGFVLRARAELESGDPKRLRAYLKRRLRDKRHDPTILAAINGKKKLTKAQIDQIVGRYSQRMLKHRGDVISRHETLQALRAAQHETYRQAIDKGHVGAQYIRTFWDDVRDEDVRFSHQVLGGTSVAYGELFVSPLGSQMAHPGDSEHGAKREDLILCRCRPRYEIDFAKQAAEKERANG